MVNWILRVKPLTWLLVAFPLAFAAHALHWGGIWVFVLSCVAIIPLAGLMGEATESLAESLGPSVGGLLNATFGNAAELIIAIFALAENQHDLVKASITGSILGNILLVLGASILCGGFVHPKQTFNRTAASLGATMLALASVGLVVPTLFYYLVTAQEGEAGQGNLVNLSEEIAGILAFMYVLSLLFTLKTHHHLFAEPECGPEDVAAELEHGWSKKFSVFVLVAATAGVAFMSELLVSSVHHAAESMGMNAVFVGVIVVAVIGNAAEHSTAILVALKNKMDLAVTIAIGSSLQIALFVAPVLVFASLFVGNAPIDLHFTPLEAISILLAVAITALVSMDGECHWMEGALLLAVYVILGLAFYHLPSAPVAPVM